MIPGLSRKIDPLIERRADDLLDAVPGHSFLTADVRTTDADERDAFACAAEHPVRDPVARFDCPHAFDGTCRNAGGDGSFTIAACVAGVGGVFECQTRRRYLAGSISKCSRAWKAMAGVKDRASKVPPFADRQR